MGRKSSAKTHTPPPSPSQAPKRSTVPLVAGIVALVVVAGGLLYVRSVQVQSDQADAAASASEPAPIPAGLKPHPQANLPPLQFPGYQMPRSTEVVTAAYRFAAE